MEQQINPRQLIIGIQKQTLMLSEYIDALEAKVQELMKENEDLKKEGE